MEFVGTEEVYEEKNKAFKEEIQLKREKQSLFSPAMAKGLQFNDSLFEFLSSLEVLMRCLFFHIGLLQEV